MSGIRPSSRPRSIQIAITRASSVGESPPNEASWRSVQRTTSQCPWAGPVGPSRCGAGGASGRNDGNRLSKTAASYEKGTSIPPGQKGHCSRPALVSAESSGRVFRAGAIPTHESVNTSRRLWISAPSPAARCPSSSRLPRSSPYTSRRLPSEWASVCRSSDLMASESSVVSSASTIMERSDKCTSEGWPETRMKTRRLGETGYQVSEIGFGAWGIGADWGNVSDSESLAALHAAVDAGVTFIDTADVYGDGRSERLVGQLLRERSDPLVVATKFGRACRSTSPSTPTTISGAGSSGRVRTSASTPSISCSSIAFRGRRTTRRRCSTPVTGSSTKASCAHTE